MWIAALFACSGSTEDVRELSTPFALTWGAANRSEAAMLVPRPDGEGLLAGIELAAPARRDIVIAALEFTGDVAYQIQFGNVDGDDEVNTIVPLSDGQLAVGGRRLLTPSADADSVAVVTLIDLAETSVIDDTWWTWNASPDADRIAGITETDDGTIALVGQAQSQVLVAEIEADEDGVAQTVMQDRLGADTRLVTRSVTTGDRGFVAYGQVLDPLDYNDFGQAWATEVSVPDGLGTEQAFGELSKVEDRATDLLVLDDGTWVFAIDQGTGDASFVAVDPTTGTVRFESTLDSDAAGQDPQLAGAPDGTVFVATVASLDTLVVATLDLTSGTVVELGRYFVGEIDRLRDLYADDERVCFALTLPGDVDGGYLASVACAARTIDDSITFSSLR